MRNVLLALAFILLPLTPCVRAADAPQAGGDSLPLIFGESPGAGYRERTTLPSTQPTQSPMHFW